MDKPTFVVAYRPGPDRRWHRHRDYGSTEGWNSVIVGPISGGEFDGDTYEKIRNFVSDGYEIVVTRLPGGWH